MKRYIRYVLLMVLSLLPINVFAATELTQAEFDAAKAGTSSIFDYDSTNHRYVFKNDGVYELAEDIDISSDSIGVVQIIILDFHNFVLFEFYDIEFLQIEIYYLYYLWNQGCCFGNYFDL